MGIGGLFLSERRMNKMLSALSMAFLVFSEGLVLVGWILFYICFFGSKEVYWIIGYHSEV